MQYQAIIIITFIYITLLTGCGKSIESIDTTIFTKARINQGGDTPLWKVDIKTWKDYGDQIQIETDEGMIILVDKSNVILLNK